MKVAFPAQLRETRRLNGLSQEKLGEAVEVTKSTISKWEGGTAEPSLLHLVKLKAALHVGLDQLISGAATAAKRGAMAVMESHHGYGDLPRAQALTDLRAQVMHELFAALDEAQQRAVIDMLKAMRAGVVSA